jgi:hypothetical protein
MSEQTESYPLALPVTEGAYPTLRFFARYGKVVAAFAGAIVCAGGPAFWWLGYGAVWPPVGLILGIALFLVMTCFAELIHLIVDTMIPK